MLKDRKPAHHNCQIYNNVKSKQKQKHEHTQTSKQRETEKKRRRDCVDVPFRFFVLVCYNLIFIEMCQNRIRRKPDKMNNDWDEYYSLESHTHRL